MGGKVRLSGKIQKPIDFYKLNPGSSKEVLLEQVVTAGKDRQPATGRFRRMVSSILTVSYTRLRFDSGYGHTQEGL